MSSSSGILDRISKPKAQSLFVLYTCPITLSVAPVNCFTSKPNLIIMHHGILVSPLGI